MKLLSGLKAQLWLAVLAFGGLVAGHTISYAVVEPDAHARQELLQATGHGSHDLFVTLGLAAAVAGLVAVVASHLRAGPSTSSIRAGILRIGCILWLLQTAGFVVLEAAERAHGLHELSTLLVEPAFLLGLVAQAGVALLAAGVVFLLRSTVEAIRRLLLAPPSSRPALQASRLARRVAFRSSVSRAAWNLRGPPIAADIQG